MHSYFRIFKILILLNCCNLISLEKDIIISPVINTGTIVIAVDTKKPEGIDEALTERKQKHKKDHILEKKYSEFSEDEKKPCCNSSNKLKIAVIGFISTTLSTIALLIVQLTGNCKN